MDTRQPFDYIQDHIAFRVELNNEGTVFTVGTSDGFRTYDTASGKLIYQQELDGSATFASVLSSSRWVALIGGGQAPAYAPNKFVLWEHQSKDSPLKIEYNATPIRACLTAEHFCVVFEQGVALYKLDKQVHQNTSSNRLGAYETASNKHGLCLLGRKKLIIPGRSKGHVQIIDLKTGNILIIPAHQTPIRAFAMSKDETTLASAGESGTLIKLWSTSQEASIMQFRRGLEHASIFSIAFSPTGDQMAVTSDKGTIHIFDMPWREETADSPPPKSRPESRNNERRTSQPVAIPVGGRGSNSPLASPSDRRYGASPPIYGISPSSGSKYKLGASPGEKSDAPPTDPSLTYGWPEIPKQQHKRTASRRSVTTTTGGATEASTETETPTTTKRNSMKYGSLGNFPLAPKFLKDTYSVMSCKFEMGNEPVYLPRSNEYGKGKERFEDDDTASVMTAKTTATMARVRENPWWVDGRAPKGTIAWTGRDSLVVIGAGRDARWERFVLGFDQNGQRGIERRGWKRYLEDEGVDG